MTELGGRVYYLKRQEESLFSDSEIKLIIERIKDPGDQMRELEERIKYSRKEQGLKIWGLTEKISSLVGI